MKKIESGNTILGILLGMLGGIALTSAMAWFIFKSPTAFVPKEQVVARNLTLPTGTVEELLAIQRRTGNPNASLTVGGYRVRTNSQHEIFAVPLVQSGVPPQPEVQIKHTGSSGGSDKQRFEFYEILSKRHYPAGQEPEPIIENKGAARITIYPAEQPVARLAPAAPVVRPVSVVAAAPVVPNNRPFASPRNMPPVSNVAAATVLRPAATPAKEKLVAPQQKPPVDTAQSIENKVSALEVDFFPNFTDAAKLQEKLLAKGLPVQLKEEKVLGKHAGYKVFVGPYLDAKSLSEAKAKLKKMGFNAAVQHK